MNALQRFILILLFAYLVAASTAHKTTKHPKPTPTPTPTQSPKTKAHKKAENCGKNCKLLNTGKERWLEQLKEHDGSYRWKATQYNDDDGKSLETVTIVVYKNDIVARIRREYVNHELQNEEKESALEQNVGSHQDWFLPAKRFDYSFAECSKLIKDFDDSKVELKFSKDKILTTCQASGRGADDEENSPVYYGFSGYKVNWNITSYAAFLPPNPSPSPSPSTAQSAQPSHTAAPAPSSSESPKPSALASKTPHTSTKPGDITIIMASPSNSTLPTNSSSIWSQFKEYARTYHVPDVGCSSWEDCKHSPTFFWASIGMGVVCFVMLAVVAVMLWLNHVLRRGYQQIEMVNEPANMSDDEEV